MSLRRFLLSGAAAAAMLAAAAVPALADRALLIGIDHYADSALGSAGLGTAGRDIAAVQRLLTETLGYGDSDIRVVANEEATLEGIKSAITDWLVSGTKPGERVFLYYSGYGYFQPDDDGDEADGLDETLVPFDAKVVGSAVTGMISDDELNLLIDAMTGRKVSVVIDAGYSGVVTADAETSFTPSAAFRAPIIANRTRSIVVEPAAQAQKAEGPALDTDRLSGDVAVFTAAAGGQTALVADGEGVFTAAFVAALAQAGADANGNGTVSNAEVLAYLRDQAQQACATVEGCSLGLTPTLGPAAAAGSTLLAPAPVVAVAQAEPPMLTTDQILDYFGKGNTLNVTLSQDPPSPVRLGTRNIRFTVTSPVEGDLVLLDLSDDGTLVQLFPNEHTRRDGRVGVILPNSPITVPDAYYGISFDATSPSRGTLIALVTNGPVEMPPTVKTRSIEVIPRQEATQEFLPAIAAALNAPAQTAAVTEPTVSHDWSVAVLRYEIK